MSRNILLIGGNTGIGLATARLLAGPGKFRHRRRPDMPGRSPNSAFRCSPSTRSNPAPLELPPALDGLVYFPGSINLKPFHRLTAQDFLTDFGINCLGAVSAIQSALPPSKPRPRRRS